VNHEELIRILEKLRAMPVETEWLEFKKACQGQFKIDPLWRLKIDPVN